MALWKHHMDEIYFSHIFCSSLVIKGKQENCWKTREKVCQAISWKKKKIVKSLSKHIANLSRYESSSKEIEILKLGLRHDVNTHPVESEMIVILEDILYQIKSAKVIKNDFSE